MDSWTKLIGKYRVSKSIVEWLVTAVQEIERDMSTYIDEWIVSAAVYPPLFKTCKVVRFIEYPYTIWSYTGVKVKPHQSKNGEPDIEIIDTWRNEWIESKRITKIIDSNAIVKGIKNLNDISVKLYGYKLDRLYMKSETALGKILLRLKENMNRPAGSTMGWLNSTTITLTEYYKLIFNDIIQKVCGILVGRADGMVELLACKAIHLLVNTINNVYFSGQSILQAITQVVEPNFILNPVTDDDGYPFVDVDDTPANILTIILAINSGKWLTDIGDPIDLMGSISLNSQVRRVLADVDITLVGLATASILNIKDDTDGPISKRSKYGKCTII